jgi:anti-sigma-K factor RskA
VSPRGVLLIASNLPALAPGRTYQMWLIPKGGAPRPAGLFRSDARGGAVHILESAVDVAGTGAMAISVEPEGGSVQPTTTPIIVAPVAGL